MSTTVVLTPFVLPVAAIAGLGLAGIVAARFLMNRTPEDLECLKELRATKSRDRLQTQRKSLDNNITDLEHSGKQLDNIIRVPLHISAFDNLALAAQQVGYKPISLDSSRVRLEKPSGELVLLQREGSKVEALSNALHTRNIQEIVRQHALIQATEHLKKRGLELRVRTLKNGEVQIEGIDRRRTSSGSGKPAKVDVTIKNDGRLEVDVNCVVGQKCDQIVSEIAQAVGAVYESAKRKPEYFQQLSQERQRV